MKNKRVVFIMLIVAIISLFSFASAMAATNTGIDVVNLSGSAGVVTVEFFDGSGNSQGTVSDNISSFGSLNFYVPTMSLILNIQPS